MKTTFINFKLLFLTLFIPIGALQAQHMKVMPDGVIIPKGDHTAIVLEENGQMVYDTVTKSVWYYNNTIWKEVGSDNLGNHTATDSLDMMSRRIYNVGTPIDDEDAVTKAYVDQDTDPDPTNEFQTMTASVEGDTLYLTDGNWLIVPGISDANYIKDFDGNVYNEVDINGQIWLLENLKTTHYNDGSPIPKIENAADWDDYSLSWDGTEITNTFDAYCWFDNDSTTYAKFGALYNWGVVDSTINGGKNACPVGYIVPSDAQLYDLMNYSSSFLGSSGLNAAGVAIKLPPGEFWDNALIFPFGGKGTNQTGFAAIGSGYRDEFDGSFVGNKQDNWLWSSTGGINEDIHAFRILYDEWEVDDYDDERGGRGATIRCIKED